MAVKGKLGAGEEEASGENENGDDMKKQYQPWHPFLTPTPPPPPSFHFAFLCLTPNSS